MDKCEKDCRNCCYKGGVTKCIGREIPVCILTHILLFQNVAADCEYYNRDFSKEDVRYNCVHFLGGGDWGLACSKHYNKLPNATSRICDDFARKSDEEDGV